MPTTVMPLKPRMADFALWVVAAEPALPWRAGEFLAVCAGNRAGAGQTALDATPLAGIIQRLAGGGTEEKPGWHGCMEELLRRCNGMIREHDRPKNWPKDSTRLSGELRRIIPALRGIGVSVHIEKIKHGAWVDLSVVTLGDAGHGGQRRPATGKPGASRGGLAKR